MELDEVPSVAEGNAQVIVVWVWDLKLSNATSPKIVAKTEKMTRFMAGPRS
jgi:hypothetical protein